MFARGFKSTIFVSVVAFFALAKGVPTSTGSSQCDNGGQLACCNQLLNSTSAAESNLGGLLGLLDLAGGLVGNIGLGCTPITVLGIGSGANCEQQVACCTNLSQDGLINLGCDPINLNL